MYNSQRIRPFSRTSPRLSSSLASARYDDPTKTVVPLWVNGKAVLKTSTGYTSARNSKTRKTSARVAVAGEEEVAQAIEGSWKAFESWRSVSGWERRKILSKVLSLLQERFPTYADALQADVSMSGILVGADQKSAVNIVDGSTNTALEVEGYIPQTLDGSLAMVFREPYGPVLSIPAFNYPLTLALRSIVYPLACGNTVILRSSDLIPQLHSQLGPLFQDAGFPDGCLQILNFSSKDVAERVEQIIAHPKIRLINFTGSVRLGKILSAKCGEHLKPCIMELGGKSPAIVLPSADLKLAANNILFGGFINSGQVCMSTERILVHQDIAKEFTDILRETATVFDKRDDFELCRDGAVDGIKELLREAESDGGELVYPSTSSARTSTASAHSPIIISTSNTGAKILREETFSPILTLQTFQDSAEAVKIANSHETGLSSSIYTSNLSEALDMARKLEVGAVHINGMTVHDEHGLPFGGVKASGWGRFNGKGAVEGFTYTKNVTVGKGGMLPLGAL